tara:strand:- start:36642 stop:37049 length:408 start_codon:yes stop_codon:yes gene_type:complete
MQDILVTYSTLTVKSFSIISGGALVAIGAAFMRFLSLDKNQNQDAMLLMKETLSQAFVTYSFALALVLLGLAFIYFSRVSFLVSCDSRYSTERKRWHERYGTGFEMMAVIIFMYVFYLIVNGFYIIATAFNNFPI